MGGRCRDRSTCNCSESQEGAAALEVRVHPGQEVVFDSMSTRVHSLHVYPVKSMAGYSVTEALVEPRGLAHDRRFMLVDASGRFLSQREIPRMARVQVAIDTALQTLTLTLTAFDAAPFVAPLVAPLVVPLVPDGPRRPVEVWGSPCEAIDAGPHAAAWLRTGLAHDDLSLVYMPDDSLRPTDPTRSRPGDIVSFADGFPLLSLSLASLADLNTRLAEPLPMDRFRPNVVFDGCAPYEEDALGTFTIGSVAFRSSGVCGRCVIVNTDQKTGARGTEPLATLATYRVMGPRIAFGQNVVPDFSTNVAQRGAVIRVGDPVTRVESSSPR